jgi:hypothetical protein
VEAAGGVGFADQFDGGVDGGECSVEPDAHEGLSGGG